MSLTVGSKQSHTASRRKDRPTKPERKLAQRIADWESIGHTKTQFHKPGSKQK